MGVAMSVGAGGPVVAVPPDIWGALSARRRQWLRRRPGVAQVLRLGMLVWAIVAVVGFVAAWVAVPAWRDGVRLWLWGYVGLALLVLAARTRTVSWRVVALTFSAGCVLALPIGWVEMRVAELVGAEVEFQDGAVLIAGPVEETLKLLPLVAVLLFVRRRVRGFAVVDFLLLGYAGGLGFQVVEDGMRPLVDSTRETTSLAEVMFGLTGSGGPEASYGITWLPGAWHLQLDDQAWFAGHAVLSALVAVGIGLAYRLRRRFGPLVLLIPVALLAMVVVDHAMMNDVANRPFGDLPTENLPTVDRENLPEGVEIPPLFWEHEVDVPGWLVRAWELWGRGRFAAPLLTGLLGVALVLDARRNDRASPGLPPLPTPGWVRQLPLATVVHDVVLTVWALGREPPVTRVFDQATGEWRGSDGSVARLDPATGQWSTAGARGLAPGDEVRQRRVRRLRRWLVATAYLRARRRRAHHLEDATDVQRHPSTVWTRVAWVAALSALVGLLVLLLNAVYGDRVSAAVGVVEPQLAFLADLLRGLAEWWGGLSFAEKTLVVFAVTGLLTFGVGWGFGLGWGFWATFGAVDAFTLVPEHGRGLADLIEDPETAWNGYWDEFTWQRGLWDGWELASAVPGHGAAGNLSDGWRSHIDEMAEGAAHQADDEVATHADDILEDATHQSDDLADTATHQADEVLDAATPSRTTPSHHPDPTRRPTGTPEQLSPGDLAPENIQAYQRQIESGDTMAQAGYNVHHRPQVPGGTHPDYSIEGRIFDVKAPTTDSARNIASRMQESIDGGQARRFLLNLDDSDVTLDALRSQVNDWPTPGLEEVIVLRGGEVIPLFP